MDYTENSRIKYCCIIDMIDFISFNLIELRKEDDFFKLAKRAQSHKSAYKDRIASKRQKKYIFFMGFDFLFPKLVIVVET